MNNGSYISATADDGTSFMYGDYAYGNHIYKLDGYLDVIHETYDLW